MDISTSTSEANDTWDTSFSTLTEHTSNETSQSQSTPLFPVNIPYVSAEVVVAALAAVGNAMILYIFVVDRKLRKRLTNYYIVSLAWADFLVGVLGIPFAILTSVGLPRPLWACILMLSTLMTLCIISIFCLVAVSVDRYWATMYPLVYLGHMTGKLVKRIILGCWVAGAIVGSLPLFGWHKEYHSDICLFTMVIEYDFLVFVYFFTIVGPGLIMGVSYAMIYSVILKQLKRPSKREIKAAKNLSIIVFFFFICWLPLLTINFVQAFCNNCPVPFSFLNATIILSHANSAINPLLYAYHMKDFRRSLKLHIFKRLGCLKSKSNAGCQLQNTGSPSTSESTK